MSVKTRSAATVVALSLLLRGRTLVRSEWVEGLENEPAAIAQQLLHPKHTQEKHRIIVILLNPLALAPRTLHRPILAGSRLSKDEPGSEGVFRVKIELAAAGD